MRGAAQREVPWPSLRYHHRCAGKAGKPQLEGIVDDRACLKWLAGGVSWERPGLTIRLVALVEGSSGLESVGLQL